MGSVKDIRPYGTLPYMEFVFSDRYSIRDYGEMPDHIPEKGRALCMMAAWNFERLGEEGVRTHYEGILGDDGVTVSTGDALKPANRMLVKKVDVPLPEMHQGSYDYSLFERERGRLNNYLVPLEIIFRNGFPQGSSVFCRLSEGATPADLDLSRVPLPGEMLEKPLTHYTTKHEAGDRELTEEEAFRISGLTEWDFKKLSPFALAVNALISGVSDPKGLKHYDGKIEVAFVDGDFMLVDVCGTFDEDRFLYSGVHVSKEVLRQWYERHHPEWVAAVKEAKTEACRLGKDVKSLCRIKPASLSDGFAALVGEMYASGVNLYTGSEFFKARHLDKVLNDMKQFPD